MSACESVRRNRPHLSRVMSYHWLRGWASSTTLRHLLHICLGQNAIPENLSTCGCMYVYPTTTYSTRRVRANAGTFIETCPAFRRTGLAHRLPLSDHVGGALRLATGRASALHLPHARLLSKVMYSLLALRCRNTSFRMPAGGSSRSLGSVLAVQGWKHIPDASRRLPNVGECRACYYSSSGGISSSSIRTSVTRISVVSLPRSTSCTKCASICICTCESC